MKTNSSLEQELKKIEDENKKLRARNLKSKTPTNNKSISHEEESTAKTNSSFQE